MRPPFWCAALVLLPLPSISLSQPLPAPVSAAGIGIETAAGSARAAADSLAAGDDATEPTTAGLSFDGKQRIRFLCIDSRGSAAVGPYGEPLRPGNSLLYRFELGMTTKPMRHLQLGGLLRISNEGERVLESGPQYLGSEWGSAYAEIASARASLRLGYYSLFMTPLTLMRWDWDDSPRMGGDAGCGCAGGAAGTLLIDSLDDLEPELTFEGGLARFRTAEFETRMFYAIPRRARTTSYASYRSGVEARAGYALEICGAEAKWQRFDARTRSFWKAALHAVGTFEDRHSVDFTALGYPATDPWSETVTVTASGEIPIVRHVRLRGEIVAWNRSEEHGVASLEGTAGVVRDGGGGIGGVVYETSPELVVKVDYLRLDVDYSAPFAALSHRPNVEGLRGSAQLPVVRDRASVALFHERLGESERPLGNVREKQTRLSGVAVEGEITGALGASAGWLEEKTWRPGDALSFEDRRRAFTASCRYEFGELGGIELQYQRTSSRNTLPGAALESQADLYAVRTTMRF